MSAFDIKNILENISLLQLIIIYDKFANNASYHMIGERLGISHETARVAFLNSVEKIRGLYE